MSRAFSFQIFHEIQTEQIFAFGFKCVSRKSFFIALRAVRSEGTQNIKTSECAGEISKAELA